MSKDRKKIRNMTKEQFNELLEQANNLHGLLKQMKYMIEHHKTKEQESKENKDFPSEMYHHGAWFTLDMYAKKLEDILYKKI